LYRASEVASQNEQALKRKAKTDRAAVDVDEQHIDWSFHVQRRLLIGD
jgi:hypothetical protein